MIGKAEEEEFDDAGDGVEEEKELRRSGGYELFFIVWSRSSDVGLVIARRPGELGLLSSR